MINITRNKHLFARQTLQTLQFLEMKLYRKLNLIFKDTYQEVSKLIQHGDVLNIVPTIVNRNSNKLKDIIKNQYKNIGEYNLKSVSNRIQELKPKKSIDYYYKDMSHNFWYYFDIWSNQQALLKSTIIDKTTKNILKNIIDKGIKDGKSYKDIAKDIKLASDLSKNRSMMIAITETHTAFNKSIFESIENTNIKMETKEWLNAGDERVREGIFDHVKANGEQVPMNDYFKNTGGDLLFPGDVNSPGSDPANIIRCRCVTLYNTEVTEI